MTPSKYAIALIIVLTGTKVLATVVEVPVDSGNWLISGTSASAYPHSISGGTDPAPTITANSTTDITIDSAALTFMELNVTGYTVNIEAGAHIENTNFETLFELRQGHTEFNIAGELASRADVITPIAAGAPSWSITLSGTIRNTTPNGLMWGQGGDDSLTLEPGGSLISTSGNGYIMLRAGADTVTFNGGTLSGMMWMDFGAGNDQLVFNAAPTGTTQLLGESGTDSITLNNSGSYALDNLVSNWEVLTMSGTAWTLTGATSNTFSDAINLNSGNLTLDDSADMTLAGALTGTGTLTKSGSHTLYLTGVSPHTGTIHVQNGQLTVNGSISSNVQIADGAILAGGGSLGSATVDGTLAPGNSPETLIVNGDLIFLGTSVLEFELDTAGVVGSNVNDLVQVNGNLTLDGTLNITDLGNYGPGTYRLFNYTGALTDNGLVIGLQPAGFTASIDTSIPGQINLTVSALGAGGAAHALPAVGEHGLIVLSLMLLLTGVTFGRRYLLN